MVTRNPFAAVAASPANVGRKPMTLPLDGLSGLDLGGPVSPPGFLNPPTPPPRPGPGVPFNALARSLPVGDPTFAPPPAEFSGVAPTAAPPDVLASVVTPAGAGAGGGADSDLLRQFLFSQFLGNLGGGGGGGGEMDLIRAVMLGRQLALL